MGCGFLLGVSVLVIVAVSFVASSFFRTSEVYREALHRTQSHPAVIAALGKPVRSSHWDQGRMKAETTKDVADLTFPIEGPNGKASVHAIARRSGHHWQFERLIVAPDDVSKPPIHLLN
ncbi:MAG: hypothetical protein NVSMB68_01010 [Thermoanaerobaculia bacterium]